MRATSCTVGGGGDHKRRQPAVDTDPAAAVTVRIAERVVVGRVQVGGLDVQRHPPAARVVGDGGEQDLGPALGEHAPQPAGVVMHPDLPDAGQRDRAWAVVVADPDRRRLPLGCLLRSRNDGAAPVFFLKRGNPTRLPLRLPERESDQAFSPLPRSTAASSNTC